MKLFSLRGFSMIELIIVVLISSLILSIAAPRIGQISTRANLESVQRNLISSLFFARAEAMKQGSGVTVCPSNDSATCLATPASWNNGWIIFLDIDGNGALDAGVDQLIRASVIPSVATVAWGGTRNITFQGEGNVITGSQGDLRICDLNGDLSVIRGVTVNLTGRVVENNTVTCP
ncbi:GspH/FimT family pseudopilin [Endozoicomonas elysicola]|uniref:Type II secretion system protein H n=1 Tax=Endozoicomonas elysicola TaxID=305900 RepID=A0A081KFB5_9GAMM|nr:GspH/FimT family pseudopilin [Endozoicomonas elysicola]KEI72841.1 hypothetical protein GV64_20830 [Endozoicomonas elysicola]